MAVTGTGQHVNLALSGGGVLGAAEAGAAAALMDAGYVVDNVAGTSAGSMLAAAIAARMSTAHLQSTAVNLDFQGLLQPANRVTALLLKVPVVGRWIAWSFFGGVYGLDPVRATVDSMLQPLGSLTWGEHHARVRNGAAAGLAVVAFNLNEGELAVFPKAYRDDLALVAAPRPISEAVAMSVAAPTFFRPPRIRDAWCREWVYSDGGTIDDTPYDVAQAMNPRLRTIAITLETPRPFTPYPRAGFLLGVTLLFRILGTAGSAVREARFERPRVARNIIVVPSLGIDQHDFSLTRAQALALFQAGYAAGQQWVSRDVAADTGTPPGTETPVPPGPGQPPGCVPGTVAGAPAPIASLLRGAQAARGYTAGGSLRGAPIAGGTTPGAGGVAA